jgi:hypothetical protein
MNELKPCQFCGKPPKTNVVEVVRCKNCAEYDPDSEWCNVWQYYLHPDFFCACGKMRADNELNRATVSVTPVCGGTTEDARNGIGGTAMENEYITKDAAIETVINYEFENCPDYMRDFATKLKSAVCADIRTDLQSLPAADVRPVERGEWLEPDDDYGYLVCSVCEERSPNDERWNFCPNCGADMREV